MQENINIPDSEITTNLSFRQLVLMNMQQLTNFPYIEKDFDALTDYELLCLVVKFLNDVIANQNEQNASITRMYQSFLALQDYVNNTKDELETAFNNLDNYVRYYFANLDVQEEINNKLDDMVKQGTLQEIIADYLNSKAIFGFDNITAMKDATNLIDGSYAKTLGYYSKNDGGMSTYKIRTITNDDVVDEASIIALSDDSLIAELITTKTNPKQFGCYGNGLNDDSTNFQKLIDYSINNNKSIEIDNSTYLINESLNITGNINLKCNGTLKTTNDISILNITGDNNNIYINKMESQERTGIAINSKGTLRFSDITINIIDNFKKGISLDTSSNSTGGIYYNYFKCLQITADKCIYLNANNSYINQNYFYMGALNGLTGIESEEITEETGEYNGNCFYNCGFENLVTALDLNNMTHNTFKDFRIYESISGNTIINLHNCDRNLFQSNSTSALLQNNKINDDIQTRRRANIFNCYITLFQSQTSQHCIKALSYNGLFEVIENIDLPQRYSFGNQSFDTKNLPTLSAINEFAVYNSDSDTTLYLDERYNYNNEYTQNLVLYVSFIGGQHDLKVYDANNNLVFDLIADYLSQGLVVSGKTALFRFTLYQGKLYPTLIYKTT